MPIHFESGHATLDKAFRIALGDLHSSILPHQSGILDTAQPMMMAGLDYESPWTRDAAINSWNAGSLLFPDIARNTLLGVLEKERGDIRIGGQYWDKIIWTCGAWHHYLVTGDCAFLKLGYSAIVRTLAELETAEFDKKTGLFRGAACFQDGVAGYPDRYACTNGSSDIRDWVRANPESRHKTGFGLPMHSASTNCLYYAAYRVAADMAALLDRKAVSAWNQKARRLQGAILEHFWNKKTGNLFYLIDAQGKCDHQEGLGAAFAILFNIVTPGQAHRILSSQHLTPHGIPCVWPTFDRYRTADGMGFGRHSGTIWPQVQGFWAEAAAQCRRADLLMHELLNLGAKAVRDAQFTEIYHPLTGEIYGGRQESSRDGLIQSWESCRRQTWSATAYIRMILHGLCGLRFDSTGLRFEPILMLPLSGLKIDGLGYRDTVLSIRITGTGTRVKHFRKNGDSHRDSLVKTTEKGRIDIEIEMT